MSRIISRLLSFLLMFLLIFSYIFAQPEESNQPARVKDDQQIRQEEQAETEVIDLGKIEVEKDVIEKPVVFPSDVNSSGQSIVTFQSNEIEMNSKHNIVDLTKDVSGVYFNKAGIMNTATGAQAPSVVKIRGIGEKPNSGLLTVVDGRPQSMGIWRHPLFNIHSIDTIETVEIIKGPAGVEYGNQAVGGVINIQTKRIKTDGMKTIIGFGLGSYNSQDYFINNLLKKGKFDYSVSAGYRSTAGDRANSDSYQENYHVGIGYELTENWYIRGNADYADILFYNPGLTNGPLARYDEGTPGETFQRDFDIRLEHECDSLKGYAIVYADTGLNKFHEESDNMYENYGARLKEAFNLFKGNLIKTGFDFQRFGGIYNNFASPPSPKLKKKRLVQYQNEYSPYIIVEQTFDKTTLSGGLRYSYNDKWKDEIIPGLGAKVNIFGNQYVFANAQKGYKTPEIGREFMASTLKPEYKVTEPERYWQYEVGLNNAWERFFYKVSAYQIEGINLIQMVPPPPPPPRFVNTGAIVIRGVEVDTYVKPFKIIKVGTLLSYLDPGKKTANIAFFNGKVYILSRILKSLSLNVETEFAKDRYDANERKQELEDYMIYNANLLYNLSFKNLDANFYMDAENILNEKYLVKIGYPVPGLLIKGGLILKI